MMDDVAALDSEALILVDEADREVGHLSKARCHDGQGVLHRAFSLLSWPPPAWRSYFFAGWFRPSTK